MASEGDFLKLLGRPHLPADVLEEILKNRNARKYHTVRRALAGHPRTPRHAALSLVSTLYWRDLAGLSADARAHPEVRRAADRDVIAVAARAQTPPSALEAIASHPRWSLRPALRSALLRNPALPGAVALSLLSRASTADLAGIRQVPGISRLVKACAERLLACRRERD